MLFQWFFTESSWEEAAVGETSRSAVSSLSESDLRSRKDVKHGSTVGLYNWHVRQTLCIA
jgi:hypothetical protein